jgi:hypothetical protein
MSEFYRIFDATIRSNFALPELPKTSGPDFSVSVEMCEVRQDQFEPEGFESAFEWFDDDGRVDCRCERKDDEYLFIFPGASTFHITAGGVIRCFINKDSSMRLLHHFLLNQIIPRYLATTGRLVLHAGAVTLENGKSVAFLGNSGFGKSTLVSSFHRNGAQLINDDCILLKWGDDGVTAIGGLAGIRLFPDSVNAVFNEATGFTNYTPYTDKQQLFLMEHSEGKPAEPRVLDAMFLLNDPSLPTNDRIRIEPVSGSEAMMAMIHSAFSLDPSDKKMITGNFQKVGMAINDRLDCYSLHYPRTHERLPDVRAAIIEHVSTNDLNVA